MNVGDGTAAPLNSKLQVRLTSNDDRSFVVPLHILRHSNLINGMIRDLGIKDEGKPVDIPVSISSGSALEKVIEWAEHHKDDVVPADGGDKNDKRSDDIEPWDIEFFTLKQATLFEIMMCANYLDIKPLLDTAGKTVANMIKGKSPDDVRSDFNMKNTFGEGEEEQIKRENCWCDE